MTIRLVAAERMDLFEIALVLAIALIVLGPERLPEVLRVTAKLLRELRIASNTVMRELTEAIDEEPPPPPAPRRHAPDDTEVAKPAQPSPEKK
jgi:Tat protein translocase TatB subunit